MAKPPPILVVAGKSYDWKLGAITPLASVSVEIFPTSEDRLPVALKEIAGQNLRVDACIRCAETRAVQRSSTALDKPIDPPTGTLKLRAITATLQRNCFKTNASI
jgi:hypothetical protein